MVSNVCQNNHSVPCNLLSHRSIGTISNNAAFVYSMQLCVDCTIPECFGGVEGEAIYIDTEGSFVTERIAEIGKATIEHCHFVADSTDDSGSGL